MVADRARPDVERAVGRSNPGGDERVHIDDGPGRGASWARQAGLEAVHGDLVLFLDDDVVPRAGLLAGHCSLHAVAAGRVVVGYMPVAAERLACSATAIIYDNDYKAECAAFDSDSEHVLRGLWGGNVSLRRVDAVRVPQADGSHAFRWREDEEFGFRCIRAGLGGGVSRDLAADHWFERPVDGYLRDAADQARAGRHLAEVYPDLFVATGPVHQTFLDRTLRTVAAVPVVAPGLRRVTEAVARRYGDGVPTRARVRAVVLARFFAQTEAARRG